MHLIMQYSNASFHILSINKMGLVNWILNKWVIPNLDYIFFTLLFPGGTLHWLAEKLYINFFEYGTRQPIKSTTNEINDWENPSVVGRRRRRMRSFSRTFYHSKKNALLYWNMRRSGNRDHDELQEQLLCEAVYMLTGPPGKAKGTAQWDFLLVEDPYSLPVGWEIFNDAFSRDGDALESLSDRDPLLKKSNSFTDIRRANKEWIKMSLPCHWQLQEGVHDIPIYTNTTYPIQFDPPRARRTGLWKNMDCDIGLGADQRPYNTSTSLSAWEPDGVNATGLYRRKFSLPRTWEGGQDDRFFLVFEGVDSCMTVWLDGNCVGYSQDSCLSAEFEITDAIASAQSFGVEHMLAVRVSRWCDGTYLEDQDKWWLSGIYREVYIVRRPKVFISDLEFSTPSINFTNHSGGTTAQSASVSVSVMLEGAGVGSLYGNGGMQLGVRADLIDMSDASSSSSSGRSVLVMTSAVSGSDHRKYCFASRNNADAALNSEAADLDVPVPAENAVVLLSGSISNPSLWTAETPHLYTLVISLHSSHQAATDDSDVLHVESCRVAVRKIHIGGSQNTLQVNNASIIVAGINRHEFSAESGRAVSLESMRQDALLIKSLNFNAVRTSHYPNHPYWLELCDEVGLFVIDEANIETHGFQTLGQPIGYLANLPEWTAAFGSRVTRMYERDKNFACVIGWSLGNESGFGKAHTGMSTWLRLRDPSRFVQYESGGARTAATDVICPMYVRPDWCRKESVKDKAKRPVILCEYAHAMGNSGGSLGKYWKDFRDPNLPRFQGGFIWDFCDQGLNLRSRSIYNYVHGTNGRRAYGYGGDFDDLPNTKQFCCNGIVGPDRYLYPTAYEVTYLQAPLEVSLHCSEGVSVSRGPSYTNVYDARSGLHISSSKGIEPNILIKNCRFHSSLSDVELVITLCYYHPILLHNRQKAVIDFPLISFPCGSVSLGPGGFHNLSLLQYITTALQSTADTFSQSGKAAISSELAAFLETYGADNAAESWLDISARVAGGQEIYHTSLSNALLHTLVSQSLASSVLLCRSLCKRIAAEKPSLRTAPISFPMMDTVACEKSDEEGVIIIRWSSSGCSARVGLSCGRLLSWSSPASGEVLCEPVDLCLYRAGTDNDRGGGPFSYYTRWKELGLDSLSRKVERKAGAVRSFFVRPTDGAVVVSASWTLVNNTVEPSTALTAANKKSSPLAIPCQATYVFFANGSINVRIAATPPSSSLLPPLPRFGLKLALPCDYGSASWFGLGPHEAYPDRQAGVYMGHFRKTVEELHTPYVFPQECGRRADPRWVIFENEMLQHCVGMFPTHTSGGAGPHRGGGWGFSASRYSLEALERTPHDFELQEDADRRVHVHLDSHMMGLGGFDSWSPNVESEFLLPRDRELVVDVTFMSFPSHGK